MWIIHLIVFYVFTKAIEWNLAISYTINSFSILIFTIILLVIFYKEDNNFLKRICYIFIYNFYVVIYLKMNIIIKNNF